MAGGNSAAGLSVAEVAAALEPEVAPVLELEAGYWVDPETDAVWGLADSPDGPVETGYDQGHRVPFAVTTAAQADWVAARIAEHQGALVGLQAQRKALDAHLAYLQGRHLRRIEKLAEWFGPQMAAVARAELAGGRSKTLTVPHGKLELREPKGEHAIEDMGLAVALAEQFGKPVIIKKTCNITPLAELRAELAPDAAAGDEDAQAALRALDRAMPERVARAVCKLKTGVGAEVVLESRPIWPERVQSGAPGGSTP